MQSTKVHKRWIDYAKAIGIILVVIGHVIPISNEWKQWIYTFHMPLFFALSGYLFNSKRPTIKVAQRLLLPLFVYMLLIVIPYEFKLYAIGETTIPNIIWRFINVQTCIKATAFWFPYSLFIGLMTMKFLTIRFNRKQIMIISFIFLILSYITDYIELPQKYYPLAFNRILFIMPFLWSGTIFKKYECDSIMENKYILLIATIISSGNIFFLSYNFIDMKNGHFGFPFWSYFVALSTVFLLICALKRIDIYIPSLEYIGKSSITIMYTHVLIYIWLSHWITNSIIILVVILIIGCLFHFIISRFKLLKFLFLGNA